MKKVIFKGIINDKEFDNVNDYNVEMNKLIKDGVAVSASSTTKIVDDVQEEGFPIERFLPFFGSSDDVYYLDKLVGEDDKLNKESLAYADKIISTVAGQLVNALDTNKITVEEAFELINKIKEVRTQIDSDYSESKQAITDLEKRISDAEKRLVLLNNALPVIDAFKDYYKSAFETVKGYLLKK